MQFSRERHFEDGSRPGPEAKGNAAHHSVELRHAAPPGQRDVDLRPREQVVDHAAEGPDVALRSVPVRGGGKRNIPRKK